MTTVDTNGDLWVDLSRSVAHPCQLRLSNWQDGINFFSHVDGEVIPLGVFDTLGFTLTTLREQSGTQPWFDTIPQPVTVELCRLEKLYAASQFAALWFVSRSAAAVDLFLRAPLLFYMLLVGGQSGRLVPERILALVEDERWMLLRVCGLPEGEASWRLLQRVQPEELVPGDLPIIRHMICSSCSESSDGA